jgi:programmed cell death protein 4
LGTDVEVTLDAEEAIAIIKGIIIAFFQHADTDDVADSACDLKITGDLLYLLAKLAINLSLDRSDSERELVSVLISDLYGYSVLIGSDLELAFIEILRELEDITVDAPGAPAMVGKFIARSVADDVLPPRFIDQQLTRFNSGPASVALHESQGLIRMRHGLVALDTVWNSGENRRPVKFLVKKIKAMLDEFRDSLDRKNLCVSLGELGIPHFHHEVVYELIVKCLEENSCCSSPISTGPPVADENGILAECKILAQASSAIEAYLDLLKHLTSTALVSMTQLESGLTRIYEDLADLSIDVPGAYVSMESIKKRLQQMDILSADAWGNIHQPVGEMFSPQRVTVAAA